ncbi:MAG: helical backbone metal receptor [Myxococcota bacterium]
MSSWLERHPRIAWRLADLPGPTHRRIVSLVPSLSEALVRIGLGDRVVGVTAYCVEPPEAFEGLARVGGTKDADVGAILALTPDLVIANQEENTPRVVRKLADAGIDVWVTYPRTVRAGAELLAELAALGAPPAAARAVLAPIRAAIEAAEGVRDRRRAAGERPVRVFCAIWRDPWMSVGSDTYIHDLIALCSGANVFAETPDGAPNRRRYPIVSRAAIEAAAPEVILLPSEPYAFAELDRIDLLGLDCPAARAGRVHLIDGTLVSWYGPRIAESIRVLGPLLANP